MKDGFRLFKTLAQTGLLVTFVAAACNGGPYGKHIPSTDGKAIENQPKVMEVTEAAIPTRITVEPTIIETIQPTSTRTIEPTATKVPTPTRELLPPDAGPEEVVSKVNDLINAGFDITWTQNEDGNLDLYLPAEINEGEERKDEKVLLATLEVESGSFSITTAKNEPFSLKPNQMEIVDGKLTISDERWGEEPILEFRNNEWESRDPGRILYLAAGENPSRLENSDYDRLPNDVNGMEPITGVKGRINSNSTRSFTVVLVDEDTVGFYDPYGMLHMYKIDLVGFSTVTGGKIEISVCQPISYDTTKCKFYPLDEAIIILRNWSEKMLTRQINFDVPEVPYEPNYQFITRLIEACESGTGYPDESDGIFPVEELRRHTIPEE